MSNASDRPAVVRQDLDNVIHPIVPHKQLEQQQLVIVSAKDSTVVDADGREYLDGMAGLWCVNIGYGRTELAEVETVMPQAQIKRITERCQELGVIVGRSGGGRHLGNTLVLAPPLVLTRPEIDRLVSVLDRVIPEVCPEAAA
jgi:adenosylmethionine-8-amino-7-oxononanoate aminotransferase